MSKKPPSINLRASLAVSPPAAAAPAARAVALDAESFLSGDRARLLSLDAIVRDERAQPRMRIDLATVEAYRDVMAASAGGPAWGPFPPVVVFGEGASLWLADGFHRIAAAEAAGVELVRAEVRPGSLRDAILHSVGANAAHGLRRSNDDKRRAVLILLRDPEWSQRSDRWIAERAAVSPDTVGRLRREAAGQLSDSDSSLAPQIRLGKDGKVRDTSALARSNQPEPELKPEAQLSDSDSSDPPEPPSTIRARRAARSVASLDAVVEALRKAEQQSKGSTRETLGGLAAVLRWAAGGDGKKARSFLRKLGVNPPPPMTRGTGF